MRESIGRLLLIVAAVVFCAGITACASEAGDEAEGAHEHSQAEAGSEHASASDAGESEGAGEHASAEGEGEHGEHAEGGEHAHGEHAEGGEQMHGEEGEEEGVYIPRLETWDDVRRGARLVLSFDTDRRAFVGRVENTTEHNLCAVRVEVHLSSGTELGPTERTDVAAGESTEVVLPSNVQDFDSWTAHPEMSPCGG